MEEISFFLETAVLRWPSTLDSGSLVRSRRWIRPIGPTPALRCSQLAFVTPLAAIWLTVCPMLQAISACVGPIRSQTWCKQHDPFRLARPIRTPLDTARPVGLFAACPVGQVAHLFVMWSPGPESDMQNVRKRPQRRRGSVGGGLTWGRRSGPAGISELLEGPDPRDDGERNDRAEGVQGQTHPHEVPEAVAAGPVDDQVSLVRDR